MKPRILAAIGILALIFAFWLGSRNLPSRHGASTTPDLPTKVGERVPASANPSQRTEHSTTRKSAWMDNQSILLGSEDPWSNSSNASDHTSTDVAQSHPDSSLSTFKRPSSSRPRSNPQPSAHHPAAWVDLGENMNTPDGFEQAIQQEAERLLEELSHLDDGDAVARNAAVARSDQHFKQRFGGRLWMQHHVHAHHLGEPQSAP